MSQELLAVSVSSLSLEPQITRRHLRRFIVRTAFVLIYLLLIVASLWAQDMEPSPNYS